MIDQISMSSHCGTLFNSRQKVYIMVLVCPNSPLPSIREELRCDSECGGLNKQIVIQINS